MSRTTLPGFRRARGQAAFTLVEIMVVLTIIITLLVLAIVKFGKEDVYSAVDALTRQTSGLVQQARFTARSSRRQVCLTFNSFSPSNADVRALNPTVVMRVAPTPSQAVSCGNDPIEGQVMAHRDVQIRGFIANAAQTGQAFPLGYANTALTLTFFPNGQVQSEGYPIGTGMTIYFSDTNAMYPERLLIYGRTGYPKVINQ